MILKVKFWKFDDFENKIRLVTATLLQLIDWKKG